MSAEAALPRPAQIRAVSLDRGPDRSFLADVVIENGPRDVLGRLFLRADTGLRERGIRLSFSDCDELKAVNAENSESWSPILPLFDPSVSNVGAHNCIAIVGRNTSGRIIFAHAARFYDLGASTLKDEIESLRLFYTDPARSALPGEAMVASAPVAARMSGGLVFGGALWLQPEYRKGDIRTLTGPIMRALSFTRWAPDFIFSFMVPKLIQAGVAQQAHLHVDEEITMINTPVKRGGTIHAGLVWISHDEQSPLFATYDAALADRDPEVDRRVVKGPADKKLAV